MENKCEVYIVKEGHLGGCNYPPAPSLTLPTEFSSFFFFKRRLSVGNGGGAKKRCGVENDHPDI